MGFSMQKYLQYIHVHLELVKKKLVLMVKDLYLLGLRPKREDRAVHMELGSHLVLLMMFMHSAAKYQSFQASDAFLSLMLKEKAETNQVQRTQQ